MSGRSYIFTLPIPVPAVGKQISKCIHSFRCSCSVEGTGVGIRKRTRWSWFLIFSSIKTNSNGHDDKPIKRELNRMIVNFENAVVLRR